MNTPIRVPKLLAFDLVGTLVNARIFHDARKAVSVDFNSNWNEAEELAGFNSHFSYEKVFEYYLKMQRPHLIFEPFRSFLTANACEYLYPDAVRALTAYRRRGLTLGFITDGAEDVEGDMIRAILKCCEIRSEACLIITSESVGGGKITCKPFYELIKRAKESGIERDEIFFVGDHLEKDGRCAYESGLNVAVVTRDTRIEDSKKYAGFDLISNLDELSIAR